MYKSKSASKNQINKSNKKTRSSDPKNNGKITVMKKTIAQIKLLNSFFKEQCYIDPLIFSTSDASEKHDNLNKFLV